MELALADFNDGGAAPAPIGKINLARFGSDHAIWSIAKTAAKKHDRRVNQV
jgi:hypothetical protein